MAYPTSASPSWMNPMGSATTAFSTVMRQACSAMNVVKGSHAWAITLFDLTDSLLCSTATNMDCCWRSH